jgi:molybdopterin molybdotransferase
MIGAAVPLASERVDLANALGRVLAEDVHSDMDMPPFNKSAMDGYACRRQDLNQSLLMVEEIPAGYMPQKAIAPGQCAKIMTGAPVPAGADCVIMVEYTEAEGDTIRFTGSRTADNICRQAEDIKRGETVLTKGELIAPAHIAILATVGCARPLVARQPRVGVIATGSELVPPTARADGASIRNSNSLQLCAQARAMNIAATDYGIVIDEVSALTRAVKQAKAQNDLIILSGGVSMGDYDLVPQILQENGFEFLFESVAMQPGRPTVFGRDGDRYCCGLPGNPVSSFVIFEILLKPFLYRLMGHDYATPGVTAVLGQELRRRKAARQSTLPVVFSEPGVVVPVEYHGSAHINAMAGAHGLITVPVGASEIKQGTTVHVRPL